MLKINEASKDKIQAKSTYVILIAVEILKIYAIQHKSVDKIITKVP